MEDKSIRTLKTFRKAGKYGQKWKYGQNSQRIIAVLIAGYAGYDTEM
jgi:hypothetical protein